MQVTTGRPSCDAECILPATPLLCRFNPDLQHPNNRGLRRAVEGLQTLKAKYTCITFADLVTLAAAVANEASGGELC